MSILKKRFGYGGHSQCELTANGSVYINHADYDSSITLEAEEIVELMAVFEAAAAIARARKS